MIQLRTMKTWIWWIALIVAACAPARAATLQGTDLQKTPAADFQLSDASGKPFRLNEQKGRVVVLTFLYTNCPDECPLIAELFHDTSTLLGTDAGDVRFVSVSLDPEHDTSEAIAKFLQAHRVEGLLTYLRGTREQLAPVWKAYFMGVLSTANPNVLAHSSRIVVIDRGGLQRSNFGPDARPEALANDIRLVLAER